MLEFLYNVAIEGDFPSVLIDWGNDKGWADREREKLDSARRLTLIPKDANPALPIVSVDLAGDRRWILFSRVYGELNVGSGGQKRVRVYCLGWQSTVGGENVKLINWIYPNGVVEAADEATLWKLYVQAQPTTFTNERVALEVRDVE